MIPLSLQLPFQSDVFDEELARSFFTNLLPESELRGVIARKSGLSEKNDFALLKAVGGECAGTVSLLLDDTLPTETANHHRLDDDEFNELVAELPRKPMLAGEHGICLSLAGA